MSVDRTPKSGTGVDAAHKSKAIPSNVVDSEQDVRPETKRKDCPKTDIAEDSKKQKCAGSIRTIKKVSVWMQNQGCRK